VVLGLGVTGEALSRRLRAGGDAVVVVEDDPASDSYHRRADTVRALGAEIVESPAPADFDAVLAGADVLVVSPGVPEHHGLIAAARAGGVPVRSEIDVAAERAAARGQQLVAVTGTNGKTTVTTLITEMLNASGLAALAAGNIGHALVDAVEADARILVAEVSSFQLMFTSRVFRPRVAVVLNVAPDHIDWHGTFERYAEAKARVFAHQEDEDLLVYNLDDATATELAAAAPSRRVGFSARPDVGAFHVVNGSIVDASGREIVSLEGAELLPHDVENALAATAAAVDLGASADGITSALRAFRRLPHRVALVGDAGGVRYFDDSKATNPHATLAALRAFDEPVVLVAGGLNKGLDLSVLAEHAPRLRGVVAIGTAGAEVEAAFSGAVPVKRAGSMRDAVAGAAELAQPGDVVLLSPACASFDWYASYSARGDDFAREVRARAAEDR
jgi:UDP-N-acetylmuramoylalanine--D-glutamate ligase